MEDLASQHTLLDYLITALITLLGSAGFWTFFEFTMRKRGNVEEQRAQQSNLLKGLAHDRIRHLGLEYIKRGFITHDEYENLTVYLYKPYKDIGGNGTIDRIMAEVNNLPILDTNSLFASSSE